MTVFTDAPMSPPPPQKKKNLRNHCFQFPLGIIVVPREIEDNGYAIFFVEGCKQGALWPQ